MISGRVGLGVEIGTVFGEILVMLGEHLGLFSLGGDVDGQFG